MMNDQKLSYPDALANFAEMMARMTTSEEDGAADHESVEALDSLIIQARNLAALRADISSEGKGKSAAESIRFEITDAMDLLDNVTAMTDSEADNLGQAENCLSRAADMMAGQLCLFAAAPELLARLIDAFDMLPVVHPESDEARRYAAISAAIAKARRQ